MDDVMFQFEGRIKELVRRLYGDCTNVDFKVTNKIFYPEAELIANEMGIRYTDVLNGVVHRLLADHIEFHFDTYKDTFIVGE